MLVFIALFLNYLKLILFFKSKKSSELKKEIFEDKVSVKINFAIIRQLLQHHFVLVCCQERILVIAPFVVHKNSNLRLNLVVYLISIVELCQQDKEIFKLIVEFYISVEHHEVTDHESKLTEDV